MQIPEVLWLKNMALFGQIWLMTDADELLLRETWDPDFVETGTLK